MESAAREPRTKPGEALRSYYARLLSGFGPQHWWPARTRLEVILGAILTQNTTWHNAALALGRLRKVGLLSWASLRRVQPTELEPLIRPAGFFRQKALALRGFLDWLEDAWGGSLARMFARPALELRAELLKLRGFGPETADAILLYAGRQPFFVADTYTRRVLARHELLPSESDYSAAQQFLHRHLPADPALFGEFHALLVEVGKRHCKRQAPRCEGCPLSEFLPRRGGLGRIELGDRPSDFAAARGARS